MHRIFWSLVALALLGLLAWYWYDYRHPPAGGPEDMTSPRIAMPPPEVVSRPPPPQHPLPAPEFGPDAPEGDSTKAPSLPALDESDPRFLAALSALLPDRQLPDFLRPVHVIDRIVVMVDNLDGDAIPLRHWPVEPAPGDPLVQELDGDDEPELLLTTENARRYSPYITALENLDIESLVALYAGYYPLFQQAYRNLGYPDGHFNDRLIGIIDHLLATPQVEYPLRLVRYEGHFRFADPELEALSWGQKTLLRMGPAYLKLMLDRLTDLRIELRKRARLAAAGGPG